MTKYLLFILFLLGTAACEKSTTYPPGQPPPALPWNVVNNMSLACDNNGNVSWVGDHFYQFSFNNMGRNYVSDPIFFGVNIADYWTGLYDGEPDTPRRFYFKYVGPVPLFDTTRIISRNTWTISYSVPESYKHTPLFEARFKNNDSLFQTFLFGDTAEVQVGYFGQQQHYVDDKCGWTCGLYYTPEAPVGLTNDTLTKILNTYLSPDSLHKLNVHWGNDGSL